MIPQIGLAGLALAAQIGTMAAGTNLPTTVPAEQPEKVTIQDLIVDSAKLYQVDSAAALAIAKCESRTRQYEADGRILRGRLTPEDVGIFQINEKYHLEKSRSLGYDIYTAEGNVGYAMWLIKHEGQKHWKASRNCWVNA